MTRDGQRLVETTSQHDIRLIPCTRWEELQETISYHAQLAALLHAPTKFVLLNPPTTKTSMSGSASSNTTWNAQSPRTTVPPPHPLPDSEYSIAERGVEWLDEDVQQCLHAFAHRITPQGVTPLKIQIRRILQSIQCIQEKIILVIATDGRPTDSFGYSSVQVDQEFEWALREIQSKAWIVIRLCTNDESILRYYQTLDDQLEFSLEVLDDYFGEAKEVHQHNPWLTYSLSLHRCREMGMSYHGLYRWLDWLDERPLRKEEILDALQVLGLCPRDRDGLALNPHEVDWKEFCQGVNVQQSSLVQASSTGCSTLEGPSAMVYRPWDPIRKRPKPWVDIPKLQRHGRNRSLHGIYGWTIAVVIVAILIRLLVWTTV